MGDATNISHYAKNLLARMRDGARPFCVINFIWEEIKAISLDPYRSCAYALIIMLIIEKTNGDTFLYDEEHRPLRIQKATCPIVPTDADAPPSSSVLPQTQ